jgi:serine/threonine protein kinase
VKQIENYVRRRYAPMVLCDVDGSSSDDGCMQKLGEQIGKGAFGTVYKALNLANGDTVAIKSVSLQNIPESDLESIMVCIVGVRACKVRARGRVYRSSRARLPLPAFRFADGDRYAENIRARQHRALH